MRIIYIGGTDTSTTCDYDEIFTWVEACSDEVVTGEDLFICEMERYVEPLIDLFWTENPFIPNRYCNRVTWDRIKEIHDGIIKIVRSILSIHPMLKRRLLRCNRKGIGLRIRSAM